MGVLADTLRQARAQKGVTLKEAEQATRINRHYLAALEEENFAVLPALIYQRGIVRSYATYLDLDPGKILVMFEEARGGESTTDLVAAVKPLEMPHHWAPNFAIITFMVVMSAIVFAWVYSLSFNQPDLQSTAPPVVPTVTPIPSDQLALAAQTPIPAVIQATPDPAVTLASAGSGERSPVGVTATADQPIATTTTSGAPTTQSALPTVASADLSLAQQALPSPTPAVTRTPVVPPTPLPPTPTPPPAAPAATGNQATIRVLAQGDINVTIVGDGVTYFSGWLGSGQATDWFTASSFEVFTSNGGATLFENAQTGQQFYMGYGANETYFLNG